MPQGVETDREGWISSDQLAMPRQKLSDEDVGAFLEFLFSELGRRPERLGLLDTAKVVRYLRTLAALGVPAELASADEAVIAEYRRRESREDRRLKQKLDELGLRIWTILLQCGPIGLPPKRKAVSFLRRHSQTYLRLSDLVPLLELLKRFEIPAQAELLFQPPALMSNSTTRVGSTLARQQNDLSERIFAAYHALRRERGRGVRPRIAEVLTRLRVGAKSGRRTKGVGWDWQQVNDRIKSYERGFISQLRFPVPEEAVRSVLRAHGQYLANFWLSVFYQHLADQQLGRGPNSSRSA